MTSNKLDRASQALRPRACGEHHGNRPATTSESVERDALCVKNVVHNAAAVYRPPNERGMLGASFDLSSLLWGVTADASQEFPTPGQHRLLFANPSESSMVGTSFPLEISEPFLNESPSMDLAQGLNSSWSRRGHNSGLAYATINSRDVGILRCFFGDLLVLGF